MKKIVAVIFLGIALLCGGYLIVSYQSWKTVETVDFVYSQEAISNPLMGYAPEAVQTNVAEEVQLVYVDITWKELEPTQGDYQFEQIEKENQFDKWRSQGKAVVLRFVMDYPGTESHKDIPDWLYRQMEDPGDWYDSSYGQGFSPNYEDEILQESYQKAVSAMAERWGEDPFIAYIELGVLGHWGEWHVDDTAGIRLLPTRDVRNQFVQPWLEQFPQAQILMRRPFSIASENNLGLYNDMFGESSSTESWLSWISEGGIYNETAEADLVAMPNAWETVAIGGELTSTVEMKELMGNRLEDLTEQLQEAHVTFLGPKIAEVIDGDRSGYETLLKNMGYRLWISQAKLEQRGDNYRLKLVWQNDGVANFYHDWDAVIEIQSDEGSQTVQVPIKLRELMSGQSMIVFVDISQIAELEQTNSHYSLNLGIVNPETDQMSVVFAVKGEETKKSLLLLER